MSQKKLNCGYIDLYLVHWPLRNTRKQTWQALEHLYSMSAINHTIREDSFVEGGARAIGVANYLVPFLRELETHATIVPAVNQVEFSPYLFLKDLLMECQSKQIQLQAYTPLVRGERMSDPKLMTLAEKYGKTPAQIILRWAVQKGVSTIPKSVTEKRLRENFDIFDFEISPIDMQRIDNFNENLRIVDNPIDFY